MQITINARTVGRILVGIAIGALIGWLVWLAVRPEAPFDGTIDETRWQAVFLENERAYFGHLEQEGEDYYLLRDAFFIQETPGEGEEAPPTREVVPVTDDFHAPEDNMLIAVEDVVVIQNLRPDSDVAEAIERVLAEATG
ncbi:MAG: hypothetical protein M3135_04855 [Actinomycetota bacterium]|nr:hypothetical protein [Actinomycetota bacterium]